MSTVAVHWTTASVTDVGIRRQINEDAILARPDAGLWVVADGMGGHEAGDVASNMVTDGLAGIEFREGLADFVDQVDDTLVELNRSLRRISAQQFEGRTMGCTVVTLLNRGRAGVALWAGDSRLYRLRDGELVQITRDHSPVEDMVEQGLMSEEEAENHPDSNIITRAVGGQDSLTLDVAMFEIEEQDIYLLCSDGLYREMSLLEMQGLLQGEEIGACVEQLLQLALDRGARDNVSVIVSKAIEVVGE